MITFRSGPLSRPLRRLIWALLLVVGGVLPTAAAAQVGVIMPAADIPYYQAIQKGIEAELAKVTGPRVEMMIEHPSPNEMAWRNATRRLITLEARVILAYGGGVPLAVMAEAPDLPVVFCAVFDPAQSGVVGPNVTGVAAKTPLFTLINTVQKISKYRRMGILFSSGEADSVRQAEIVASIGGDVVMTDVKGLESIIFPDNIQAIFMTCAGAVQNQKSVSDIVGRARAGRIATASVLGESSALGVMVSMAVPAAEMAQKTAKVLADALSKGTVSGVPLFGSGSQAELNINREEVKALGFTLPDEFVPQTPPAK